MADEDDDVIPEERFTPEPEGPEGLEMGDENGDMPPLAINGQYIKDFSFEAPNAIPFRA